MRSSSKLVLSSALLLFAASCATSQAGKGAWISHLKPLTTGGWNADPRWSSDGGRISFARAAGRGCGAIDVMNADGSKLLRVSSGKGRARYPSFAANDERIVFSANSWSNTACEARPKKSEIVAIDSSSRFDSIKTDGTDLLPAEPAGPTAYNSELATCHDGSVVFTSDRDGDLELYRGRMDNFGVITNVKRITERLGYDGQPSFSPDCREIAWRASSPRPGNETGTYLRQLKRRVIHPQSLEIWIANSDGTHARQLTALGAISSAPAFTPDGRGIIFSSNFDLPRKTNSELFFIRSNGTGLTKLTSMEAFTSYPAFSPDGEKLALASGTPDSPQIQVADFKLRQPTENRPEDRYLRSIARLSSPEMDGRGAGSEGLARAETWVLGEFREIGLRPFFKVFAKLGKITGEHGYEQAVPMKLPSGDALSHNLLGVSGPDCGREPAVLITAHLDHLGHGGPESLDPAPGKIHPGADDNASGVAGVLEIARALKGSRSGCFVYAALTGEELGDIGSSRLAKLMHLNGFRIKAVLNLDMIGRMENNRLIVFGTESGREWKKIVRRECAAHSLSCPGGGDGFGPSDQMPFYEVKIPVLHFFTGPHADYHRSTDTADKINATGGIQVVKLVTAIARDIGPARVRIHYQKPSSTPMMNPMQAHRSGIGILRAGAYLGTIPDYSVLMSPSGPGGGSAEGGGVPLQGVRAGSPAEKAGVRAGDVLVEIDEVVDGKPVKNRITTLQVFTNVLRHLIPGERVTLRVRRGTKIVPLTAIVGARSLPSKES